MSGLRSLIGDFAPWLRLWRQQGARLGVGAALMLATVASGIGLLGLSGWFITASALVGVQWALGRGQAFDIYTPGGGIRLFALTRTLSRYLERLYNHDTVLRMLANLRTRLFRMLATRDGRSLRRLRLAQWLNRLTADIDALDNLYLRLLAPPMVALAALLGLAGLTLWWLPPSGLGPVLLLFLLWLALVLLLPRLGYRAGADQARRVEALRIRLLEHLQGMAPLAAFGILDHHRQALDEEEARWHASQERLTLTEGAASAIVDLGVGLAVVLMLWLAALAHAGDRISAGVMVLLPLALLASSEALAGLPAGLARLGSTRMAARRLNALEEPAQAHATGQAPDSPPELHLEAIRVHYPGALRPALENFSLQIPAGSRCNITGASGTGKSTLAQLLAGLIPPDQGGVYLDGRPLQHINPQGFRERLALLTQQPDLFDQSIRDNLRLARPTARDEQIWKALAEVGLADWARQLPEGLDTTIGENGSRVSDGQGRRLALARLLLREPVLVILDEPFAGLDPEACHQTARALAHHFAHCTLVILTHEACPWLPFDQHHALHEQG